jgi:hypothetical protein
MQVRLDNKPPTTIIGQRRIPGQPRVDWSDLDADRAYAKYFFERLKRTFWGVD